MLGYIEIVHNHTSDLEIHESWYLRCGLWQNVPIDIQTVEGL